MSIKMLSVYVLGGEKQNDQAHKNYFYSNIFFQLQYLTLSIIEGFVPASTKEYEQCRIIVSNSTHQQLKQRLACFGSDLYTLVHHMQPAYESYIKTAKCFWSLIGKLLKS